MSCDPAARCHLKEQRDLLRSAVGWPVIIDLWILAVTAAWMFVPGMALAAAIVGRPSFWIVPVAPAFTILMVACIDSLQVVIVLVQWMMTRFFPGFRGSGI